MPFVDEHLQPVNSIDALRTAQRISGALSLFRPDETLSIEDENLAMLPKDLSRWLSLEVSEFTGIADSIENGLRNNQWTAIIGDDVAGRLPALFVKRMADNVGKGFKQGRHTRTYFVAGGYEPCSGREMEDLRDVDSRVAKLDLNPENDRALLVTEICRKGLGVAPIIKALSDRDIACDLLVVNSRGSSDQIKKTLIRHGCNLPEDFEVIIARGPGTPGTYLKDIAFLASGVQKKFQQPLSTRSPANKRHMLHTRRFIDLQADRLSSGKSHICNIA